jgi:hypothetical protein
MLKFQEFKLMISAYARPLSYKSGTLRMKKRHFRGVKVPHNGVKSAAS